MLLTVEGGGFFSSSASGYRSGLSLLLLGGRTEEGQMRVLPWTQNQFVEREVDPNLHLASRRSPASYYRCSSFTCFRHISTATEGPNPPKVGPLCRSVSLPDSASASERRSNDFSTGEMQRTIPPKSILKRSSTDCSALVGQAAAGALGLMREEQNDVSACIERRKVHWTDKCGKELAQIREFEISDMGPFDDESGRGAERRCRCIIQ